MPFDFMEQILLHDGPGCQTCFRFRAKTLFGTPQGAAMCHRCLSS
ncbi:hypothetical protein GLE_0623 [Lysobacter enzymogenes]|uniref:Uncharacterized protein n=1 Tax=Lysobacter enzymogenes TaxID=69 RepID=A0A0S2DC68_LYSEN|nr:hypothetical protein GLE_0623 [Lysobacter enzymogenes]